MKHLESEACISFKIDIESVINKLNKYTQLGF